MKNQPNNILLMTKTLIAKTSIFKAFAAVCIFGICISGCTSKKRLIWKQSIQQKTN